MTMLDKDKLEELEEEFEQHPDGIELVNFVWLMKSALKVDKNDEYDLIYGLWRLFSDIDTLQHNCLYFKFMFNILWNRYKFKI